MAEQEYRNSADEVTKRVRRIETRLTKLCGALGIDSGRDRERVVVVSKAPLVLEVAGFDVSVGDLLDACRKSGISGVATLRCKGRTLGTIQLDMGESH